jgi:hypothetical protein
MRNLPEIPFVMKVLALNEAGNICFGKDAPVETRRGKIPFISLSGGFMVLFNIV